VTKANWQIVEVWSDSADAGQELEVLACVEGAGRFYVVAVGGPGPTPTDPAEMLRVDVTTAAGQPLRLRGGEGRANRDDSVNVTIFDKPDASVDALTIGIARGDRPVSNTRVRRP